MTTIASKDLARVSGGVRLPRYAQAGHWASEIAIGLGGGAVIAGTLHAFEEIDPFGLYSRLTR